MAAGGRISLEKGFMSLSRKTIWIGGALLAIAVAVVLIVVYPGGGGGGGGGY